MFQENKDVTFGSLAIFSIPVAVLWVMRIGGEVGEEDRLVGVEEDVGMDHYIFRKKSSFLNTFIGNWKPVQERFITVNA